MSRIAVIGGTGYAGSAIAAQAAGRGHQVTALSRSAPDVPIPGVTYIQGDVADDATLATVIAGSEVVVGAIAPRGGLSATGFREVYRTVARLADAAGASCSSSAATPHCARQSGQSASSPTSVTSPTHCTRKSLPVRHWSSRTSPPRPPR